MRLRRCEATDAGNVRSVIWFLGLSLLTAIATGGWLAYVLSTRAKDTLPDAIVPLLTALGTITGVIAGQLGSLLSRTSTVPPSQTNTVNAIAPDPAGTVTTTREGLSVRTVGGGVDLPPAPAWESTTVTRGDAPGAAPLA